MKASDYTEGKGWKERGKDGERERQLFEEGKAGTRPERVAGDK